jgi:periplasmic protein TorT
MRNGIKLAAASIAAATVVGLADGARAADQWWPFPVFENKDGELVATEYVPLEKASQKWDLCVLFPHLKDSYWVAVDYGIVEEAKRLGVKATVLQAGGYDSLPKQISQFDDCVAAGADAIITAPISEAGMAKKLEEGMTKGIPQFGLANPIIDTPVTGKVTADFVLKGRQTGEYLVEHLGDAGGKAVSFPGPQGSGWAESYAQGFREALEGTSVELLEEKYGDTGVAVQLRLVEDALQTYPDMTAIWGTAPTVEGAIGAVAEAGLADQVTIMASYENQGMLDAMRSGEILGFATEFPVIQARMAVDMAVRALEDKLEKSSFLMLPKLITNDTAEEIDLTTVLAPADWQPVYAVD